MSTALLHLISQVELSSLDAHDKAQLLGVLWAHLDWLKKGQATKEECLRACRWAEFVLTRGSFKS